MTNLMIGHRNRRVITFMTGLRDSKVAVQLIPYGFDDAAMAEGWELLHKVTGERLDAVRIAVDPQDELLRLDAWENHWFPIASAVLRRHVPEVHGRVFRNLTQTSGAEVVISVNTFLKRLGELSENEGKAVFALLGKHGMTTEVLNEARALLRACTSIAPISDDDIGDDMESMEQDERALWEYYLQWSAIARQAISDRRLLRKLGFLEIRRRGPDSDNAGDGDGDGDSANGDAAPDLGAGAAGDPELGAGAPA